MKTGIELIADERQRQKSVEGWTEKHDDQHWRGEMANAAACYAATEPIYKVWHPRGGIHICELWPWDAEWDKRKKHDRKRQLVIAGALIAAELDRLNRKENP